MGDPKTKKDIVLVGIYIIEEEIDMELKLCRELRIELYIQL